MKSFATVFTLAGLVTFLALIPEPAEAQRGRISYERLLDEQRSQGVWIDSFTLPAAEGNAVQFVMTIRNDFPVLNFRKSGDSYLAETGLNVELFEAREDWQSRDRDDFSVEELTSVERTAWRDTARAASYEETRSAENHVSGMLSVTLEPGTYHYLIEPPNVDLRESSREMPQRRQRTPLKNTVTIDEIDSGAGEIILLEPFEGSAPREVTLLNFGSNVYYGQNYAVLVRIPASSPGTDYRLVVERINREDEEIRAGEQVHTEAIGGDRMYESVLPRIREKDNALLIDLEESDRGHTYALATIPNEAFPNALFRIAVVDAGGEDEPVLAQKIVRSQWKNMPVSLLNIDVAIDMLKFITDGETLRELGSGSQAEKERKFREFWEQRDPTPDTEYNELMEEYYRRIDEAYEKFTTLNIPGFETDQGEIYIKYGPPDEVNRRYPPGESALEVWDYGNRQFIFRAVSGFGQFELVSRES